MEVKQIIDRMAAHKKEQSALDDEYSSLQSKLQILGESALEDTKYKSVSFSGTSGKATVTLADKVSNVLPSLFVDIFGKAYNDLVNVTQKIELNAEGKRIAAAVWNKEYCEGSVEEIISSLKIGWLSEEEASDNAYLVAEIISWNKIRSIIKLNNSGVFSQPAFEQFILNINAAVCVEQSTKVAVESLSE